MIHDTTMDGFQDIIEPDKDGTGELRFNRIELRLDFNTRWASRFRTAVGVLVNLGLAVWIGAFGIERVFELTQTRLSDLPIVFAAHLESYRGLCDLTLSHLAAALLRMTAIAVLYVALFKKRRSETVPTSMRSLRPWTWLAVFLLLVDTGIAVVAFENGVLPRFPPLSLWVSVGLGLLHAGLVSSVAFFRVEAHFSKFV